MSQEDKPIRDVQLLQTTMDFIEKNPEQHDQDNWVNACGTAFCYAGHAALLAGAARPGVEVASGGADWYVDVKTQEYVPLNGWHHLSDDIESVSEFAERKLGLNWYEGDVLFHESRTREELRILVDAFSAGARVDKFDVIWIDDESHGDVEEWLRLEVKEREKCTSESAS